MTCHSSFVKDYSVGHFCDSSQFGLCFDAAGKFLNALMQTGTLNEATLCSQELDRIYGPLREQVAQSLKRQDTVLRQLKVVIVAVFHRLFIFYL